jgi:hypothetical protein
VEVRAQTRLSPGFAGNPQDLLELDERLLVSRLESNPEGSDGSDLLILDKSLAPIGRIDLSAFADPGLDPMPTRLVAAGDLIWVGLTHMSRADFAVAGPGRLLALSRDLEVLARVDLPDLTNCGNIATSGHALWAICAGHFRADREQRRAFGGLVRVPLPASPPTAVTALTPDFMVAASEIGPLAFPLAPVSDEAAAVVLLGDLVTDEPDRLVIVHSDGRVETLAETTPFSLSGLLYLPERQLLLAADSDARRPRLLRFSLATSPPTPLMPVVTSKTGLPPRHLGHVRP